MCGQIAKRVRGRVNLDLFRGEIVGKKKGDRSRRPSLADNERGLKELRGSIRGYRE